MTGHRIMLTRPAEDSERDLLARLCVGTLATLPIGVWLAPEPRCRALVLAEYAWAWVERGIEARALEVAETSEGALAGVAVWWPGHVYASDEHQRRLSGALRGEALARFRGLNAVVDAVVPQQPHLFLGFAAVWPNCRRRGYGSELLRRRHVDLDSSRVPAFTVATSLGVRRFLAAYGYEPSGPAVSLPDEGPELQPMWRSPAREAGS